jgi:mono/diheme cytochrome c family protein
MNTRHDRMLRSGTLGWRTAAAWAGLVLGLAGCGGSSGTATNTTASQCTGSLASVTYSNFAQSFLSSYCVSCHGAYGSYSGAVANAASIDSAAGANPAGTIVNTYMPPSGSSAPSTALRTQLGCWVALGAPQ